MKERCEILIAGSMGTIAHEVRGSLEAHGLRVKVMDFPQNICRDVPGYRRALIEALKLNSPAMILPVGNTIALASICDATDGVIRPDRATKLDGTTRPDEATKLNRTTEPESGTSTGGKTSTGGDTSKSRQFQLSTPLLSGVRVPIAGADVIRTLDGKVSLSRLASQLGIRQPHIYVAGEGASSSTGTSSETETGTDTGAADAIPDEAFAQAQVVFKRDISFGGHGVHIPRSREALRQLIAHQSPQEPFLVEEFIAGEDLSVDAVRWDGFYRCQSYRVLEHNGNGPSTRREVCSAPEAEAALKAILDHLDYHGVCGADFRIGRDGHAYMLECNPRFTGGIASQVASGFDIPYLLWQLASEGQSIG